MVITAMLSCSGNSVGKIFMPKAMNSKLKKKILKGKMNKKDTSPVRVIKYWL